MNNGKEKIILLVEDNPDDVALTERAFRKNNIANEIVVARDGAEAIEYLFGVKQQNPLPQVVLLDLKLPRVDGFEVLRRIRENERTRFLPVVIMTTSNEQQDIVKSYHLHANSYVRKPINFNEFVGAVNQLGIYWLMLNETAHSNES